MKCILKHHESQSDLMPLWKINISTIHKKIEKAGLIKPYRIQIYCDFQYMQTHI